MATLSPSQMNRLTLSTQAGGLNQETLPVQVNRKDQGWEFTAKRSGEVVNNFDLTGTLQASSKDPKQLEGTFKLKYRGEGASEVDGSLLGNFDPDYETWDLDRQGLPYKDTWILSRQSS